MKSVLSFESFIVDKITFTTNSDFKPIEEIEVDFTLSSRFAIDDNNAKVTLFCSIFKDPEKENKPFSLEVILSGLFEFEELISDEEKKKLLEVNATAILFPYLRVLVSTIVSSSGFPTLILPIINVNDFIQSKQNKM